MLDSRTGGRKCHLSANYRVTNILGPGDSGCIEFCLEFHQTRSISLPARGSHNSMLAAYEGGTTMKHLLRSASRRAASLARMGPFGRTHHKRAFCYSVGGPGGRAEWGPGQPGSGLPAK